MASLAKKGSKIYLEDSLDILKGHFERVIFKSDSFCVYRFFDESEGSIAVVGDIHIDDLDAKYKLFGTYEDHVRFGIQFHALHFEKALPDDLEGIKAYLSSPLFKGIGPKKAEKIVRFLKEDTLEVLKHEAYVLRDIGIKDKDINTIQAVLSSNLNYEESFYTLLGAGLNASKIKRLIAKYETKTLDIIQSDPFFPYFDLPGFGFQSTLKLAQYYELPLDDERYLIALLAHVADELSFQSGDSLLKLEDLKRHFMRYQIDQSLFDRGLELALDKRVIYKFHDHYMHYRQYEAERLIANFLYHFSAKVFFDDKLLDLCLKDVENSVNLKYGKRQKEALYNFYHHTFSLILGSPGSGKTTIIKAIVMTLKELMPNASVKIIAPTGRAAKRIGELTGVESMTIHSLLKWNKDENTFEYSHDNPLLLDVLIIDEFSMVDNVLFAKLIDALYDIKKICIIGDINQLPSVNAGCLLKNIAMSQLFTSTKLDLVYRQSETSDIITLAQDIIYERVDFSKYKKDIFFHENVNDLTGALKATIDHYLDDGFSLNDIQVLSPMYKGKRGINYLNEVLENIYNPIKDESIKDRYRHFKKGDKIIQLRNQSTDDIYNGDIGIIEEIVKTKGEELIVACFNDQIVEYSKDEWGNLALAYCISVHKSQGSEYPIVILVYSKENNYMLNKALLYTAISRASYHLHIFGNQRLFMDSLKKSVKERKSGLEMMLKEGAL